MRNAFWLGIHFAVLFGCGVDEYGVHQSAVSEKDLFEDNAAQPVALAIAGLTDNLPEVDYRTLLSEGVVVDVGQTRGSSTLTGELRRLLLVTGAYRQDQIGSTVVRVQRFRLNDDFPAVKLIDDRLKSILPFDFDRDTEIEFARVFENEYEADSAESFKLTDYPFDADSTLALPVGTVVSIPIQGAVSLDASGRFLSQAARFERRLLDPLSVSASGNTSGVRQGTLLASGQFVLQIVRLQGERARVRIQSNTKLDADARVRITAGSSFKYLFLPSSHLDRIRALRRHLENAAQRLSDVRQIDERLDNLGVNYPMRLRVFWIRHQSTEFQYLEYSLMQHSAVLIRHWKLQIGC